VGFELTEDHLRIWCLIRRAAAEKLAARAAEIPYLPGKGAQQVTSNR
jgi:hypothetical protein